MYLITEIITHKDREYGRSLSTLKLLQLEFPPHPDWQQWPTYHSTQPKSTLQEQLLFEARRHPWCDCWTTLCTWMLVESMEEKKAPCDQNSLKILKSEHSQHPAIGNWQSCRVSYAQPTRMKKRNCMEKVVAWANAAVSKITGSANLKSQQSTWTPKVAIAMERLSDVFLLNPSIYASPGARCTPETPKNLPSQSCEWCINGDEGNSTIQSGSNMSILLGQQALIYKNYKMEVQLSLECRNRRCHWTMFQKSQRSWSNVPLVSGKRGSNGFSAVRAGRWITCDSEIGSLATPDHLRLRGFTCDSDFGSLVPSNYL